MKLSAILTQTVRNLRQTWGSQIMTLATVTLSVLIFSFFFLIFLNLKHAGIRLGDNIRLFVYLDHEPTAAAQVKLAKEIKSFGKVDKIVFKSSRDAFVQLKQQLGPDRDVLDDFDPGFLPPFIEIYPVKNLSSLSHINNFAKFLATLPGAQKVQYGRGWIERLGYFTQLIRLILFLSGGLLVLTATFMVSSTVRLTVVSRRPELEIMRLIGASRSYIQAPLLLEGLLQGLLGSGLGIASLYLLFKWLQHHFTGPGLFKTLQLTFLPPAMTGAILVISILLCTTGSIVSIRKFLRL